MSGWAAWRHPGRPTPDKVTVTSVSAGSSVDGVHTSDVPSPLSEAVPVTAEPLAVTRVTSQARPGR